MTEPEVLARIKALVLPPAWQDVWICPWPNGHIQAVGTDAAGRRRYRYHDAWRVQRDRDKHDRVLVVAQRLPAARDRAAEHLALRGYPRSAFSRRRSGYSTSVTSGSAARSTPRTTARSGSRHCVAST